MLFMRKLNIPFLVIILFLLSAALIEPASPFLVPYYDEETGLYGYCTPDGENVISPQFLHAELFSDNGLALVIDKDETGTGVIDKTGKYILPPKFRSISRAWSCGLIPLSDPDVKKFNYYTQSGYYNEQGRCVIKPQYDYVSDFSDNGLALVRTGSEKTGTWEYINRYGKTIITPDYDYHKPFENGLAAVRTGDDVTGKWGFIDELGNEVISPRFDYVYSFAANGLARVRIGDAPTGKWGYIDKTGNFVIKPEFDEAEDFSENGLARIRIDESACGKWGFIDRSGSIVIKPQFDIAYDFLSCGLAKVWTENEEYSYINEAGEFITDPKELYPKLYAEKGPICVASDGGYKYLDENGETIFRIDMQYAGDFTEDGIAKAEYYRYDDYSGFEMHRPIYHYINTRGEIIRPR